MRLEIRYSTQFSYTESVRESHNVLRACPATNDHQRLLDYHVAVEPPGRILTFTDYWGTRVDAFGIRAPHGQLIVTAEATVETLVRPKPTDVGAAMTAYREQQLTRTHHELLQQSPHARGAQPIAERARAAVADHSGAVDAVRAIHDAVRDHMEYAPGATFVGMDVNDVFDQARGVCQDFAHLAIAMYRSVGIPARYVSGYLYARDQSVGTPPTEAEIEIQTHAWVEALVPAWGWWALDPTNPEPVGERHIKIGHGRDYDDVPPLRGVYHGTEDHELGVRVQISRERLSQMQVQQ